MSPWRGAGWEGTIDISTEPIGSGSDSQTDRIGSRRGTKMTSPNKTKPHAVADAPGHIFEPLTLPDTGIARRAYGFVHEALSLIHI